MHPAIRTQVEQAITDLQALLDDTRDPLTRAAGCPDLQDRLKAVVRAARCDLILDATDPPRRHSNRHVAERLGIHPNKVSEARRDAIRARGEAPTS